jgi:hypothetical protein
MPAAQRKHIEFIRVFWRPARTLPDRRRRDPPQPIHEPPARLALSSLRSRRGRRPGRRRWFSRGGPGGIAVCATKPYFHDETAAFLQLEGLFWPHGPVCPRYGSVGGKHYDLGKTRVGLRKGSDCRKQFTVKGGTVFASAHIHSTRRHRPSLSCAPEKKARAQRIHHILRI